MSVNVLAGPLASLAPKLAKLLHDEYKIQKGMKKQVQWLNSELESIHAFLGEVSKVSWDQLNEQVKVWVREVREASYDMEDVLDTYLVRVDGGEPTDPSRLKCAMKKMGKVFTKAKARRGIAGAIQDMKKHLEEIAQRRQKYKFDEIITSKPVIATATVDPQLTAMCKQLTQLIGVDKSTDQVISMLNPSQPNDEDKKLTKKVSIVGVGGLGKTTLARVVYEKLKSQYNCAAFVSVGRDLELVKVFKDILYDLDKEKYKNIHSTAIGEKHLISEIQEYLENKRYFIVIDDLWDVRTWEAIKLSLVENNCGSIVITTTRKIDVANEAGDVYKLNPLSDDDSMKLFYTRIFGAKGKYHDNQPEDVINKILKKCGGIPLAIMTISSLMAGKQKYEWSEVLNSIGFGSKGNREAEDMMIILSCSYYDLPPHLRTCLLYLSTYPEDYEIAKDSLIRMWIAEGFIDGKQGTRSFELGERYFNDLINRSLIQAVENTWDGRVLGCRVHDMVLDLLRKLSSEENFIAILGDNVEGTHALSNVRRLTHQNRISEHINSDAMVTGMPKVRSYAAFMCFIDSRDQFLRFKLLRVLHLVHCNFKEGCFLEHLGDLHHLRYLWISWCGCSELPKEIGNLKFLQTLDVSGTLPASIVQLQKLVRLRAHVVPDGIGKLVSLEELLIVPWASNVPERFFKEIGSLQELRVLRLKIYVMDESMQRDFVESLSNLQKIQYIHVHGSNVEVDTAMWEAADFMLPRALCHLDWFTISFSKFPSWINATYLPNMSYLDLSVITMDEQDMQLLARLPTLCFLGLGTRSTVTLSNVNACDGCFFPKLRYFLLREGMVQFEQPNQEDASVSLHIWNGEDARPFASRKINDSRKVIPSGVMPNLEVLDFKIPLRALKDNNGDCGNIGLEYLPSLRKLDGIIICDGMTGAEIDDALALLGNACKLHPNNPTFVMIRSDDLSRFYSYFKARDGGGRGGG